jgi:hypothetical protein
MGLGIVLMSSCTPQIVSFGENAVFQPEIIDVVSLTIMIRLMKISCTFMRGVGANGYQLKYSYTTGKPDG